MPAPSTTRRTDPLDSGTVSAEQADALEARWRALRDLGGPSAALVWLAFTALGQHATLLVVALVGLVTSPYLNSQTVRADDIRVGLRGEIVIRTEQAPAPLEVADLLSAGLATSSTLWIVLALGLMAVGFAIRQGRHRLAGQVLCVAALPFCIVGLVQLGLTLPCGVPGAILGGVVYASLAVLCGLIAYRLGQPATRDVFAARAASDEADSPAVRR